jgi:hypothetical protein
MSREFLRSLLIGEAHAYGFTIAFWGAGIQIIRAFGMLDIWTILTYGSGAVTGFGILIIASVGAAVSEVEYGNPRYVVLGTLHYAAALGPIAATHVILELSGLSKLVSVFLAGMVVSILYNGLAALEETFSERLWTFEQQHLGTEIGKREGEP